MGSGIHKNLSRLLVLFIAAMMLIMSSCSSNTDTGGSLKDGTYTGIAKGLKKNVHVYVTVKGGKIADVKMGPSKEDEPYLTMATEVIPMIMEKQGTEGIEVITGATYTSEGIFKAVDDALLQAKGDWANSSKGKPSVKTRSDKGNPKITWLKPYDSKYEKDDWHNGVALTNDGGYMTVLYSEETDQIKDGILMKYNAKGKVLWEKRFKDSSFDAITKTDYGYLVTGHFSDKGDFADMNKGGDDALAVMFDDHGTIIWKLSVGGSGDESFAWGFGGIQLANGNLLIPGGSSSKDGDLVGKNRGERDAFLVEVDLNGRLVDITTFGGTKDDELTSVEELSDGGFILSGYTASFDGAFNGAEPREDDGDIFILKLDKNKKTVWTKRLASSKGEWGGTVLEADDGGILFCGTAGAKDLDFKEIDYTGKNAMLVIKMDRDGNRLWAKAYNSAKNDGDGAYAYRIAKNTDGTYIVYGEGTISISEDDHEHSALMYVIDEQGNVIFERTYYPEGYEGFSQVLPTPDKGFIAVGWQVSKTGDWDGVIIKYAPYK